MKNNLSALILAAGLGKRMKSKKPKLLHEISCKPLISHVIDTCLSAGIKSIFVVLGNNKEDFVKILPSNVKVIYQKKQLGTADAIKSAKRVFAKFNGKLLILYGDMPLIKKETLKQIVKKTKNEVSLISFEALNPKGYGRVVSNKNSTLEVVEEKNASNLIKKINNCYSGVCCAPSKVLFSALDKIKKNSNTKEYLFTDIFDVFNSMKIPIKNLKFDQEQLVGINNKRQLVEADEILQERIKLFHLDRGVTILSPKTVYIASNAKISSDVVIGPNVFIGNNVKILSNTVIKHGCSIEDTTIKENSEVGPMSRLRNNTKIGNFVEIKNSITGDETKISHLSYIGDSKIGKNSNIGAGTITCNFDCINKNKTFIGDNVFIGSNCSLIAPIRIKDNSFVAAGSSISKNVEKYDFSISRARQQIIKNGSKRFLKRN